MRKIRVLACMICDVEVEDDEKDPTAEELEVELLEDDEFEEVRARVFVGEQAESLFANIMTTERAG